MGRLEGIKIAYSNKTIDTGYSNLITTNILLEKFASDFNNFVNPF